jgi:prepilin-type N-terminal cleavage/methylation domain-containing protein
MKKTKNGFTIIEVVLVLAIAGLIFMMVFIALPALQRSQRDTQRSNDLSRLSTALNNFQGNNRGSIPTIPGTDTTKYYVPGHDTGSSTDSSWLGFYDRYLIVNSAGSKDVFADPDGSPYALSIVTCTAAANAACQAAAQRKSATFDKQSTMADPNNKNAATGAATVTNPNNDHSILVVLKATCSGEDAVGSTGARKVALLYKKEGGGTICVNN